MLKIIPQPKQVRILSEKLFEIDKIENIHIEMETNDIRIISKIEKYFPNNQVTIEEGKHEGFSITAGIKGCKGLELNQLTAVRNKQEGYYLRISDTCISIYAENPKGLYYGIQTLKQICDNHKTIHHLEMLDWPDVEMRSMYFDLRQVMPKFDTLINYIDEFAQYKINTLIMEYEDKLPFRNRVELTHKELAFTQEQVELIKKTAYENFIEIIPLQQTFGHLEYVTKHKKYEHLRENHNDLASICPSNPEAYELVSELLNDLIEMHPEARYVLLGCDEVMSLCKCDKCIESFNGSREKAFIYHVNRMIDYTVNKGKFPIIYHDMMEKFSDEDLKELDRRVVVMIWIYNGTRTEERVTRLTAKLRGMGIEVMGAPSVACHDRTDNQNYPIIANRIPNILDWTMLSRKLDIKSMVITNWSIAGGVYCPYGIYETSLYLSYLAAEKLWNVEADKDTYLMRFLNIFHGISTDELEEHFKKAEIDKYYEIIGELAPKATKRVDTAEWINVIREYELALFRLEQVGKYVFRVFSFKECEAERHAIKVRYSIARKMLEEARERMRPLLAGFLPDYLVEMYMNSRFFLADFISENLYEKL